MHYATPRRPKAAPLPTASKPLPKPLQGRVERLARRVAGLHAAQIHSHITKQVQTAIAKGLPPYDVDRLVTRLEALPPPTFAGWPDKARVQGKKARQITPTVRMTLNTYSNGKLIESHSASPGDWTTGTVAQGMCFTTTAPLDMQDVINQAIKVANDLRASKRKAPPKVRKPTEVEAFDAMLRTPDSDAYWRLDDGPGHLVSE